MNTRDPQALIEKLKSLLPERIAEIWENDADAAYDRL